MLQNFSEDASENKKAMPDTAIFVYVQQAFCLLIGRLINYIYKKQEVDTGGKAVGDPKVMGFF